MVKVGDEIRLSSGKGPAREGVVVAVTGAMLRVRWPSSEESSIVPGPGSLTVLAPKRSKAAKKPAKKSASKPAKKSAGKKAKKGK
jgi:hypothetical protein